MKDSRMLLACGFVVASIALGACRQTDQSQVVETPPDTRTADEAAIRDADAQWAKAVAAKDVQKIVSFYADGASLTAPGAPIANGKEEIQKAWTAMAGIPGFALTFTPTKVVVGRSGDMAYELGEYEMTVNDKNGKPQTTKAKYVVVWGKQPDGKWKALVDAPTTTQ
jgi:uncharacterized protein (TIGR02246 family)